MQLYATPGLTLGRFFLTFTSLFAMFGPFIADFNETHVYNPKWPPHARFHNGQTMSMGVTLGLTTLMLTYRSSRGNVDRLGPLSDEAQIVQAYAQLDWEQRDVLAAAITGSMYWATALTGPLYPGAAAMDPEFGKGFPQLPPFTIGFMTSWLGWWLESRRIVNARLSLDAKAEKLK